MMIIKGIKYDLLLTPSRTEWRIWFNLSTFIFTIVSNFKKIPYPAFHLTTTKVRIGVYYTSIIMILSTLRTSSQWRSATTSSLRFRVRDHIFFELSKSIGGTIVRFGMTISIRPWVSEMTITSFGSLCLPRSFFKFLLFNFLIKNYETRIFIQFISMMVRHSLTTIWNTPKINLLIFA